MLSQKKQDNTRDAFTALAKEESAKIDARRLRQTADEFGLTLHLDSKFVAAADDDDEGPEIDYNDFQGIMGDKTPLESGNTQRADWWCHQEDLSWWSSLDEWMTSGADVGIPQKRKALEEERKKSAANNQQVIPPLSEFRTTTVVGFSDRHAGKQAASMTSSLRREQSQFPSTMSSFWTNEMSAQSPTVGESRRSEPEQNIVESISSPTPSSTAPASRSSKRPSTAATPLKRQPTSAEGATPDGALKRERPATAATKSANWKDFLNRMAEDTTHRRATSATRMRPEAKSNEFDVSLHVLQPKDCLNERYGPDPHWRDRREPPQQQVIYQKAPFEARPASACSSGPVHQISLLRRPLNIHQKPRPATAVPKHVSVNEAKDVPRPASLSASLPKWLRGGRHADRHQRSKFSS